jgi:hypothetical protein
MFGRRTSRRVSGHAVHNDLAVTPGAGLDPRVDAPDLAEERWGDDLRRLPAGHERSAPQDHRLIRKAQRMAEIMKRRHDEHAPLGREAPQDGQERDLPVKVERGGGLVEEQDLGLLHDGLRGADELLLPAAEVADTAEARAEMPRK